MATEEKDALEDKVPDEAEVQDDQSLARLLAQEKEKAERYLANWQRTEADFRNYKARQEQEKKDLVNWGNSALVCDIVPVLDAFDRAFETAAPKGHNLSWLTGFKQIQKMLQDILAKYGVTEVKCLGEVFDPNRHEAVAQQPGADGLVVGEVRKGYVLKDKLIRAPQVVVGKGEETPGSESTKTPE